MGIGFRDVEALEATWAPSLLRTEQVMSFRV